MNDKIAFVDVDGTLTNDISSWEKVHTYFAKYDSSILEQMKINNKLFHDGKIDYNQWASLDVSLWKGKPISMIYEAVIPPILRKNAKEGIDILKRHGYKIILLSGGISIMVNEVAKLVGADEYYAIEIVDKSGIITGEIVYHVENSKGDDVVKIAKAHNVDLKNCIAIGDNFNDIEMFKKVGYSLAINPVNDEVASSASYNINTISFVDAVNYFINNINHKIK